ncbi:MAG: hypothetical protein Q8S44_03230 [Flavobacteriaceae bacterium]|nr:hypothetical protein [Flavobacteriaceae bacterium]
MKSIKLHTTLTTWLLALFLVLPTLVQFNHSFENHSFNSITKEGINQDNSNNSCQVFHHLFLIKSSLVSNTTKVNSVFFWDNTPSNFKHLIAFKQLFSKTYRGPPSLTI